MKDPLQALIRENVDAVLRDNPRLVALHKRGKTTIGGIVGLVVRRLQEQVLNPRVIHTLTLRALVVASSKIVTEPEDLNLIVKSTDPKPDGHPDPLHDLTEGLEIDPEIDL